MKCVINDAPAGTESYLRVDHAIDTLIIWVATDLDELSRRRYIEKARREHITDRRRSVWAPLLPVWRGPRRIVRNHSTGVAAGAIAAAGIAAAAVIPLTLDSSSHHITRRPPVAAAPSPARTQLQRHYAPPVPVRSPPAPQSPAPNPQPKTDSSPTSPRQPVATPQPSPAAGSNGRPATPRPATLPILPPVRSPVTMQPPLPVPVPTPTRRWLLDLNASPVLRVRLGLSP
jgi:hypothetical protein